jgi:hypothetical protein
MTLLSGGGIAGADVVDGVAVAAVHALPGYGSFAASPPVIVV